MRGILFASGLLAAVVASGCARAADLPATAPAAAPVCVGCADWNGFYIGIHGGGAWGHTSFQPADFSNSPELVAVAPPSASPKGAVFGGQAGYNWQWGRLVGGLEVDFSGADLRDSGGFVIPTPLFSGFTFTRSFKIEDMASVRARFGYLINPNWLLYGTGGLALANTELDSDQLSPTGILVDSTSSNVAFGWVAGAGLEWKLWDHWLLRGEWLHYDFGTNGDHAVPNFSFDPINPTPPFQAVLNTRTSVDVARVALSYKFCSCCSCAGGVR